MKAIQILESQLEELEAKRTRMAEKGLDSAVIGMNQAVRDAREAIKCAQHGASTIDAEYCAAVERNGNFVYAYPLPGAKTLAGAKRAAASAVGGISGTLVLFRENAEVGRKEGKRWEITSESSVQKKSLAAIGARDDVLAWRQQSGAFRALDNPSRIVKVGTPGISDAMAVVSVEVTPEMVGKKIGVAVGIEFKSEKGRQSDAQRRWQEAFECCGGTYAIVRGVEDAVALVERVKKEGGI